MIIIIIIIIIVITKVKKSNCLVYIIQAFPRMNLCIALPYSMTCYASTFRLAILRGCLLTIICLAQSDEIQQQPMRRQQRHYRLYNEDIKIFDILYQPFAGLILKPTANFPCWREKIPNYHFHPRRFIYIFSCHSLLDPEVLPRSNLYISNRLPGINYSDLAIISRFINGIPLYVDTFSVNCHRRFLINRCVVSLI